MDENTDTKKDEDKGFDKILDDLLESLEKIFGELNMDDEYEYYCEDCEALESLTYGSGICRYDRKWHSLCAEACDMFRLKKPGSYRSNESEDPTDFNDVRNPEHYCSGGIECLDAIKASMPHEAFVGYLKGNVIKYIWRYDKKGQPYKDLQKALFYLRRLIDEI